MSLNQNVTDLDHKHYSARMFDSENDAQRVILINGTPSVSNNVSVNKPEIQVVYVTEIVKQIEFKEIQVIVTEYKTIEVPTIINSVEIKVVEVPVIQEVIKYREVEKPIYIKEIEKIEVPVIIKELAPLPVWLKYALIIQMVSILIVSLVHLIK